MINYNSTSKSPFYFLSTIKEVELPKLITLIGSEAFCGCSNLQIIPNNVTSIRSGAFKYCSSLQNFTIPPKVTTISDMLFNGCANLSSIEIHYNAISIKSNMEILMPCFSKFYNST